MPAMFYDGGEIDVLWDYHDKAIAWYETYLGVGEPKTFTKFMPILLKTEFELRIFTMALTVNNLGNSGMYQAYGRRR